MDKQRLQDGALNRTLTLLDGRTLGYAEYGDPAGVPIFCFHGGNLSRYEGLWYDDAAKAHHIRLIVPDRPGFGLSDFQPNRQFLDWPKDVVALADSLSIDRFSIFGLSGAAPHVLATAYALPERVAKVAVVSGVAPPEAERRFQGMWFPVQMLFFFARYAPPIKSLFLKQMAAFYSDEEQMRKRMLSSLPKPDVDLIAETPDKLTIFAASAKESHRNGVQGDAWEWHLYVRPWGFRIADIKHAVGLWYGRYDRQVTVAMGEYYARTLPHNDFKVVEDGGHLSTINNYIGEILDYLQIT